MIIDGEAGTDECEIRSNLVVSRNDKWLFVLYHHSVGSDNTETVIDTYACQRLQLQERWTVSSSGGVFAVVCVTGDGFVTGCDEEV